MDKAKKRFGVFRFNFVNMAKAEKKGEEETSQKYLRTSFNVDPAKMKKLRVMAALKGDTLHSIVDGALQSAIEVYEKDNGLIPVK